MESEEVKFYMAIALFGISEGLAFIKKVKPSGILHFIWCLCKGSECIVKKTIDGVEVALEYEDKV